MRATSTTTATTAMSATTATTAMAETASERPPLPVLPREKESPTPSNLLREAAAAGLDALDARVLLCHALGWPRTALITRSETPVAEDAAAAFRQMVLRRHAGEPVAQLVEAREFYGRTFRVTRDVLIPRPETELLVELTLSALGPSPQRVLDLGTGSGAIAVTLAAERTDLYITATDRDPAALQIAEDNAARLLPHRPPIRFLSGCWFDALEPALDAKFDVVVSNPPYIAARDEHLQRGDLRFEPLHALTDGADGLSCIRDIAKGARDWLHTGGWLLIEHGHDQGHQVRDILRKAGFHAIRTERDLAKIDRVTVGKLENENSDIICGEADV